MSYRQRGQILILATLFITAIMAVVFGLFQSGWSTTEKTRLQTVADAASYSAAVLQARDLNYQAHMNRAMVANQTLVGQAVAMSSYLQVNQQMWYWLENAGDVAQYIPYIGPLLSKATDGAQTLFGTMNKAIQRAGKDFTTATNVTNIWISKATQAWHLATVASTLPLVDDVVTRNDPTIKIPALGLLWLGLDIKKLADVVQRSSLTRAEQQGKKGTDRMAADQFRQVIMDSTDAFTRNRSRNFWDMNLLIFRAKMTQVGGTELGVAPGKKLPYYSWSAVDTVSLHTKGSFCWFRKCKWKESVPVAWGRQATWHKDTFRWQGTAQNWNGAATTNSRAWQQVITRDRVNGGYMEGSGSSIATSGHYKVQLGVVNNGFGKGFGNVSGGMQDFNYWDSLKTAKICDLPKDKGSSQGCPIRVVLLKPDIGITPVIATEAVDKEAVDSEAVADNTDIPMLQAVSAAAALFEPPIDEQATKIETGNLYHPYWVARLISWPSEMDRLLVQRLAQN